MQATIHPNYTADAKLTCACGNEIVAGSTMPGIGIEVCSACHPFFTGKQNFVDTSGRIEKFAAKAQASAAKAATTGGKKAKAAKRAEQKAAKKAAKPTLEVSEA